MKVDGTGKWYVSRYELYPIYEPAEGGYYYNGVECSETYVFNTRKKAMKFLRKMWKDCFEVSNQTISVRWKYVFIRKTTPFWNNDHTYFGVDGNYVGEGFFWQLERVAGISERGYEPYC